MTSIHHVAIWVRDLEKMKNFYEKYFKAKSGEKYINPTKKFESYFLTFEEGNAQLELMFNPYIPLSDNDIFKQYLGVIHFAVQLDSEDDLEKLVKKFEEEEVDVISDPRITGDGFYEAIILDPEGNRVELTCGKIFPPKKYN
jgi:lactoylglutathione lyase